MFRRCAPLLKAGDVLSGLARPPAVTDRVRTLGGHQAVRRSGTRGPRPDHVYVVDSPASRSGGATRAAGRGCSAITRLLRRSHGQGTATMVRVEFVLGRGAQANGWRWRWRRLRVRERSSARWRSSPRPPPLD